MIARATFLLAILLLAAGCAADRGEPDYDVATGLFGWRSSSGSFRPALSATELASLCATIGGKPVSARDDQEKAILADHCPVG